MHLCFNSYLVTHVHIILRRCPCCRPLLPSVGNKYRFRVREQGRKFLCSSNSSPGIPGRTSFQSQFESRCNLYRFGVLLESTWALLFLFICSFSWQFSGSASAWFSIPFLRVKCWSLQRLPGRLPPLCKRKSLDVWVLDTSSRHKQ